MTARFPGSIYDGDGAVLAGAEVDLSQGAIDTYPCRDMVCRNLAPVARVWTLDDGATFAAVPMAVRLESVDLMMQGRSIVILSRCRTASADVTDGLLALLRLAETPHDLAGHA